MATTQIEVYNLALGHLGTTRLHPTTGLTENRPDRRELDAAWSTACSLMLEAGVWDFATRVAQATADPDISPNFGRPYAFGLPDDFVRLAQISIDEDGLEEDRSFKREGNVIYSQQQVLYLGWVSSDDDWGGDLGKMSALYARALGAWLAELACINITKDQNLETKIMRKRELYVAEAKRADARDERVKEKPMGSWVRSRFAYPSMRSRGNRM